LEKVLSKGAGNTVLDKKNNVAYSIKGLYSIHCVISRFYPFVFVHATGLIGQLESVSLKNSKLLSVQRDLLLSFS